MDVMLQEVMDRVDDEWPEECFDRYERIDVLGKGSFGLVWLARRKTKRTDEFDDEFVAIKSILIKNEKGKVYAEREIRILQELRHPHIIRLIHAYDVHADKSRVVVMQLARGPNLHQLVVRRGALGLPLSRMVTRQLIAAVSYLHGRAVLHRDIKPSNCILALRDESETIHGYNWVEDDAIWSNRELGEKAVASDKWKLMLVDFGFARALEKNEIESQSKKMRNSIVFETSAERKEAPKNDSSASKAYVPRSMYAKRISEEDAMEDEDDSIEADMLALENIVIKAADNLRKSFKTPISRENDEKPARQSMISMMIPEEGEENGDVVPTKPRKSSGLRKSNLRRKTVARQQVRSMSALGTKAYAAPEIRKELRHKNEEDTGKANAAMTECVADYGMIVDAYSVGWTLRVALTGVLPQFTISEYMEERELVELEQPGDEDLLYKPPDGWCCCEAFEDPIVRIRDPSMLPPAATLLITRLTEKNPEDRMTVREAQNDPYIAGEADEKDPVYSLPSGDVPSGHGDPVVPLECAAELSRITVEYHTA